MNVDAVKFPCMQMPAPVPNMLRSDDDDDAVANARFQYEMKGRNVMIRITVELMRGVLRRPRRR